VTDKQRIAQLEKTVERLEQSLVPLVERACRDKYGRMWVPERGPWRSLILRARRKAK
jgi:hypothetical protein